MAHLSPDDIKYIERFGWGPEERCIVKYVCAWKQTIPHQGRIYITQDHLAFHSKNLFQLNREYTLSIAWKDIASVSKQSSLGLIPNAILVTAHSGEKYDFTSFVHRDQAFDVLQHFLDAVQNPPLLTFSKTRHVVHLPGGVTAAHARSARDARGDLVGTGERSAILDEGNERLRRTLAQAEQTRSHGAAIMEDLDRQSGQLNRIAGDMQHVHRGLNQADKILGQMETILPGGGRNAARDYEAGTTLEKEDPRIRETKITALDITRDNYLPREFVFPTTGEHFHTRDVNTGERVEEYSYDDIATVVVGHVPGSLRLKFRHAPELYLVSKHYDTLVEEFVQRPKHEVHVEFENGADKFPYFNREGKIQGQVRDKAPAPARGGDPKKHANYLMIGSGKFSKMSGNKTMDELRAEDEARGVGLLGTKVQQQHDEGDDLLDGISHVMHDLKHMAEDMNVELKYQNALVDNIDESVDRASSKFDKHGRRVKKLT